jgi:hypothetical protein
MWASLKKTGIPFCRPRNGDFHVFSWGIHDDNPIFYPLEFEYVVASFQRNPSCEMERIIPKMDMHRLPPKKNDM